MGVWEGTGVGLGVGLDVGLSVGFGVGFGVGLCVGIGVDDSSTGCNPSKELFGSGSSVATKSGKGSHSPETDAGGQSSQYVLAAPLYLPDAQIEHCFGAYAPENEVYLPLGQRKQPLPIFSCWPARSTVSNV